MSKDFLTTAGTAIDHVQNVDDGRHCERRSLRLKRSGAARHGSLLAGHGAAPSVAEASRQRRPIRRFRGRPCVCAIIARQSVPLPEPARNGRRSTSELPTMPACSLRSSREKTATYSGRRGLRRAGVFMHSTDNANNIQRRHVIICLFPHQTVS